MSIKITFTIQENHQNPHGNPVPFTRMLASQMNYASGRYVQWQSYVRNQFDRTVLWPMKVDFGNGIAILDDEIIECLEKNIPLKPEMLRKKMALLAKKAHPIKIKNYRAWMELKIYWCDESHGDSDNVFKGVADSLFENDKELDGSFESFHQKGKGIGHVDGIIIFDAGMKYVVSEKVL